MLNRLITLTFTLALTGCSGYGGDWPKLNDPLPDPKERQRIHATADIKVAPQSVIESDSLDFTAHQIQRDEAAAGINAAWNAFEIKLNSIEGESDAEDRLIAWTSAQLALSRVSAKINKLKTLAEIAIAPPATEGASYHGDLMTTIDENDQKLKAAKEKVAALKPN